jgi:hypothetical protein
MNTIKTTVAIVVVLSATLFSFKSTEKGNGLIGSENSRCLYKSKMFDANILAPQNMAKTLKGGTKIYTTFNSTTANSYGSNLFMHISSNPSGSWSSGTLPSSYSSPNAVYVSPATYAIGSTVYVFYSTSPGSAYPAGSSSPIYSMIVQ